MTSFEDELSRALTTHVGWPLRRWSVSHLRDRPSCPLRARCVGTVAGLEPKCRAPLRVPGEYQSNTDKEEQGRPKRLRIKVVRIVCMDGDAEAELKWYRWR